MIVLDNAPCYTLAMKAARASDAYTLADIPNLGPAMVRDLALIDITKPNDLKGKDAYKLYRKLCTVTGMRQDPCVLDTFMAMVDFMDGAPAWPWWHYTATRKKQYPEL